MNSTQWRLSVNSWLQPLAAACWVALLLTVVGWYAVHRIGGMNAGPVTTLALDEGLLATVHTGGSVIGEGSSATLFCDFECPYCAALWETIERAIDGGFTVRLKSHANPVDGVPGFEAEVAVRCAGDQGRYVAFAAQLYRSQEELRTINYEKMAHRAGVADILAFRRCLVDEDVRIALREESAVGGATQIPATPALALGDTLYIGLPTILRMIDYNAAT